MCVCVCVICVIFHLRFQVISRKSVVWSHCTGNAAHNRMIQTLSSLLHHLRFILIMIVIVVVISRRHCSIITMPVSSWQHFRGWASSPHTCDNAGMVGTLLFPGYPGESFCGGGHPQKPGLLWEEAEGQRRSRMLRGICGTLRRCQRDNLVKASKHRTCTSISICQVKWNVSAFRGRQGGKLVKASKHRKCTSICICQVKWNLFLKNTIRSLSSEKLQCVHLLFAVCCYCLLRDHLLFHCYRWSPRCLPNLPRVSFNKAQ